MSKEKKTKSTKPVNDLSRDEELTHYMSIMIEDFHSKLDLVVEGMNVMRREMRSEIASVRSEVAAVRADMNNQFSFLNSAIRCNADGIKELRADVGQLKSDVGQLKTDMVEVKGLLNHVVDRVDDHEERIGRIERVG